MSYTPYGDVNLTNMGGGIYKISDLLGIKTDIEFTGSKFNIEINSLTEDLLIYFDSKNIKFSSDITFTIQNNSLQTYKVKLIFLNSTIVKKQIMFIPVSCVLEIINYGNLCFDYGQQKKNYIINDQLTGVLNIINYSYLIFTNCIVEFQKINNITNYGFFSISSDQITSCIFNQVVKFINSGNLLLYISTSDDDNLNIGELTNYGNLTLTVYSDVNSINNLNISNLTNEGIINFKSNGKDGSKANIIIDSLINNNYIIFSANGPNYEVFINKLTNTNILYSYRNIKLLNLGNEHYNSRDGIIQVWSGANLIIDKNAYLLNEGVISFYGLTELNNSGICEFYNDYHKDYYSFFDYTKIYSSLNQISDDTNSEILIMDKPCIKSKLYNYNSSIYDFTDSTKKISWDILDNNRKDRYIEIQNKILFDFMNDFIFDEYNDILINHQKNIYDNENTDIIFYIKSDNDSIDDKYNRDIKICYFKNLCVKKINGIYQIYFKDLFKDDYKNQKLSDIHKVVLNLKDNKKILSFENQNKEKIKLFGEVDKYYYMSYYFNDGYEFDYIGDNYIKFVDLQFIFYKISLGDSGFRIKPEHIIKYIGNTSNEDLKNILIMDSKLRYNHNKLWALIYLYITRFIKVCKCCHCCNGKYKICGHCLCPKCKFDCLINFHTIIKPLNLTKDELIFYNTCLRYILISDLKLKKMLIEYLDKKGIKYKDFINNDEELFNLLN